MNDFTFKKEITATELKQNLGMYLDYVSDNHEVIITKNGKKTVRLTPYITDLSQYYQVKEEALDYQYCNKKVTYEEFMEIYENSELRMEFINGEIVVLGSPNVFHQEISGNLYLIFRDYLRGKKCKVYYAPFDVHFNKKNVKQPDVMQPDLLIACDVDETTNDNNRYMGTPTLVVEILSKSTRSRDMVIKLNTYMLSGVREFWVVDPKKLLVMVYSFKDCEIEEYKTYKIDEKVMSLCFEGLEADTAQIFEV